jgi:hypothetical protein
MITSTINMDGLNAGIAGLINGLGLESKVVLKKEAGELVKSLIRITPPSDRGKTLKSVGDRIKRKFQALDKAGGDFQNLRSKVGASGVKWYASNSDYLFGALPENDMRGAGQDALLHVLYRTKGIQEHARIVTPFKKRRARQRVAIMTRVITKRSQVAGLITRIKNRVGRMKAGWLGDKGDLWKKLSPSGSNMPPDWVMKHISGSRGFHIDLLSDARTPSITIGNRAPHVEKNVAWLLGSAVQIRAKAMVVNLSFYLSGKKNLRDYAKP